MFFRRERQRQLTFDERTEGAQKAGFERSKSATGTLISRKGIAALVKEGPNGVPQPGEAGLLFDGHIAQLVDGGYQKFFATEDGHKMPALAEHLKALHAFSEDLYEALGLVSLYNTALGSICNNHLYDRVKDRDKGVSKRPWQ